MKRWFAMLMAALLLMAPALAEEIDRQAEARAAYARVLLDGEAFVAMDEDMRMPEEWNPVRFTLLDLDGDEVSECIVELTEYEAFIILTWVDGEVLGCEWPYRGLNKLKDDGTFSFSSGALDSGVGMLLLQGDDGPQWGILPLAESISEEDENGNVIVTYYLDGGVEETDEDGYLAALAAQDDKLDALWYTYNEETLKLLLGR